MNADDFGLSAGVNRGVVEAHEHGIVTSASLMVRYPAAAEAGSYGRRQDALSLGLHVDLGEWVFRNGEWVPLYEIVDTHDAAAVNEEVCSQLATFRRLVGRDPTHIDSHQHVHLKEPVRSVLSEHARALKVPLRHFSPKVRYRGDFYGQTAEGAPLPSRISVEGLLEVLNSLQEGVTELACHPGQTDDLDTMYRTERALEVETLCDPQVRAATKAMGVELCSFREYDSRRGSPTCTRT